MTELEQNIQNYFGVSEKELALISSFFKEETLEKGDFFLKKGQYVQKLSFVKSGILRIYVETNDKEVTQWISTKGYFVTDLSSFVFEQPARFYIQALTPVELFSINKENYNQLSNVVQKWHFLEKLFIARCFTILEDRILAHLSMSSEERYVAFFEQNSALFNQVPLQYIASMLGMTPETLSRIRKKIS